MQNPYYVAIMAGGIGSRFWPSSRSQYPKQFLDILGVGKSLLQLTIERFEKVVPRSNILIVTNIAYKDIVKQQVPDFGDDQILYEPSRNNTAPCIAYTAFRLHAYNPNATFVVAPSDHVILKTEEFVDKIKQSLAFASQNEALLTLGIQPTRPNTGYGYIHFDKQNMPSEGTYKVNRFMEKPNLATATQFVESGEYLWNAGIFIWNVRTILQSLQTHAPSIYALFEQGQHIYGTAQEQDFINKIYPTSPDISIDYAIMEKANNIYTLPADIGWSDLGTWASLYEELDKDDQQNAIASNQRHLVELQDCQSCIVRGNEHKIVVVRGLENYIIVDEKDALLIYPKQNEQDIKQVVQKLTKNFGERFS